MAPIYLGKRVVPSSLRYIENLALHSLPLLFGHLQAAAWREKQFSFSSVDRRDLYCKHVQSVLSKILNIPQARMYYHFT